MKKANVATVQMDCAPLNTEGNLERAISFIRVAKRKNAELVVLPHMFATGYNVFLHPSRVAEDMKGPTVTFLKTVAKKLKIHLVGGFVEKSGKRFYDTTIVVDPMGAVIGSYRRMSIWLDEMNDFSRGDDLCLVDLPMGRAGLLVSRDFTIPELARTLAFEGAELLIISGALDDHAYWEIFCRSRAIENACFVVAANRVGVEKNLCYCGHSMIIDPEGHVLADAESRQEATIAELNPKIMSEERAEYWQLIELEESLGIAQGEYLSEPLRCRPLISASSSTKKKETSSKGGKARKRIIWSE